MTTIDELAPPPPDPPITLSSGAFAARVDRLEAASRGAGSRQAGVLRRALAEHKVLGVPERAPTARTELVAEGGSSDHSPSPIP